MRVLFYHASAYGLLDRLVAFFTFGPYSHVSILLNEDILITSTAKSGVTVLRNSGALGAPGIDIVNIPTNKTQERDILERAYLLDGLGYDYYGAILNYFGVDSPNRWYCSELIAFLLYTGNCIPKLITRTNPNSLFNTLMRYNFRVERNNGN